jgi:hypothetical protein
VLAEEGVMAFAGSEELIAQAESKLGRRLPEAHRHRLLRENGGEVSTDDFDWTLFPVWDPTDRRTVARTANHIVRQNENLRADGWGPAESIAIADNGEGDLLVIGPDGEAVMLWDHETGQMSPVQVAWD